jgi:outer membrane protein assembly factor BamB
MKAGLLLFFCFFFTTVQIKAQPVWQAGLDGKVRFYQTTDFGIVLAGSDNSLYALDGKTGDVVWRRKHKGLDETSITPVPSTDLILLSLDEGDKARVEAVDLLSGMTLWRSDKVKGDVMQLAVDPDSNLLALVLVKKAKGKSGDDVKRKPVVHSLDLSTGKELWKKDLASDIEMMPASFSAGSETNFTLDNYRPPLLLDGRLFLFYEGVTSYDARTGKEGERDKFKVNEDGLALTETDPVFDDQNLYVSGRGKVRAINRRTGKTVWEAKDLGVTPEIAQVGNIIYARTGGQFTRIKDGEIKEKGDYGVSAIDSRTGKTVWRFKGADKGITNFAFADANTIVVADKDDLVTLDARGGKRLNKVKHGVEHAQFLLVNERGEAVVGGQDEIAAFRISDGRSAQADEIKFRGAAFRPSDADVLAARSSKPETEVWRVRHPAPGRGVFRTVVGVAARAVAMYFRYGGLATSGIGLVRGTLAVQSALTLRWSGLRNSFSSLDLTSLAVTASRNYVGDRVRAYGMAARFPNLSSANRTRLPDAPKLTRGDVQESILDKLDPARTADKISDYFFRRRRLAELHQSFMYFYTELPKPFDKKGLVGVNVQNGQDARYILISEPDAQFTTDCAAGLLYSANGNKLQAFDVMER